MSMLLVFCVNLCMTMASILVIYATMYRQYVRLLMSLVVADFLWFTSIGYISTLGQEVMLPTIAGSAVGGLLAQIVFDRRKKDD